MHILMNPEKIWKIMIFIQMGLKLKDWINAIKNALFKNINMMSNKKWYYHFVFWKCKIIFFFKLEKIFILIFSKLYYSLKDWKKKHFIKRGTNVTWNKTIETKNYNHKFWKMCILHTSKIFKKRRIFFHWKSKRINLKTICWSNATKNLLNHTNLDGMISYK